MLTHPLKAFVGENLSEFAGRAGVSRTSLSRVLGGKRNRLSADACMKLSDATDGKVAVRTLLDWKWPWLEKKAGAKRAGIGR